MKSIIPFCLILALAQFVAARDLHMLPEGAGKMDGSSWEHALAGSAGMALMKRVAAGRPALRRQRHLS